MTYNLQRVLDSKRALRSRLASLPIAEKLKILDTLHERELAIRAGSKSARIVREGSVAYRTKKK